MVIGHKHLGKLANENSEFPATTPKSAGVRYIYKVILEKISSLWDLSQNSCKLFPQEGSRMLY